VGKERLLSANIADRYDPSLVCPPQCLLVVNAGCV
jgi:hypothetical protein